MPAKSTPLNRHTTAVFYVTFYACPMYSTFPIRFLPSTLLKSQHFILSSNIRSVVGRPQSTCTRSIIRNADRQQLCDKQCFFHSSSIILHKNDEGRENDNTDDHNLRSSNKVRSPYAVLKLRTSATTVEIKNNFRKVRRTLY